MIPLPPFLTLFFILAGLSPAVGLADDVLLFPTSPKDLVDINICHKSSGTLYQKCSTCVAGNSTGSAFVNYTILLHTLRAGGLKVQLDPVKSPNSERSRIWVTKGLASIRGDWDFNIDGNTNVYKSDAFIRPGRITKGLYGLPANARLHSVKSLADLQNLTATTSPTWRLDWKILSTIGLKKLEPVSTKANMFSLVQRRGIDFTLLEFTELSDLSQVWGDIRLVPAKGVKIALPNSQHFMISKRIPRSEDIRDGVNRGLAKLHASGFIDACLRESGLVNPQVQQWVTLNPFTEPLTAAETRSR